ncbi:MAG TPA: thiamine phosphate synthase [Verrucomicrobiae bacterium]
MKPLSDCKLYAFVDTTYSRGRKPDDLARQLCDGGADIIQLRAKHSGAGEIQRMAEAILPVTRAAGVPLVINDWPEVAAKVGAEFCHLGQEDFFGDGHLSPSEMRARCHGVRLGLSTHDQDQATRALAVRPDYIGVGPIYATPTKAGAIPVTVEYVRWAERNVSIPWFAIGGITLENLGEVLAAGARRICVVSAILTAEDVSAACRAFKDRL